MSPCNLRPVKVDAIIKVFGLFGFLSIFVFSFCFSAWVREAVGQRPDLARQPQKKKLPSGGQTKPTFQKRMWPVPDVMSWPSKKSEKDTWKTSWLKALERSTIDSCFQLHTVSQKSGKEPTEASCVPSLLKRSVE